MSRRPPPRSRNAARIGAAILLVVALLAAYHVLSVLTEPEPPPTLVAADRGPFRRETIGGRAWLVHPTVGFRIRDPGASFALDVARPSSQLPATWLYRDAASGHAVSILLDVPPRNTHSAFNSYVDGAKRGMRQQGAVIDSVRSTFFAARGECEIDARVDGERIIAVTHVFETGRIARTYRVAVSGPAELRAIVTSFELP